LPTKCIASTRRQALRGYDGQVHVLRLASVFEPPPESWLGAGARLDPVGGMQSHTGSLTRALDALGVSQDVVTAHRRGGGWRAPFARRSTVWRVGLPVRAARQLWAPPGAALALSLARRADVVHAHAGEDVAVLPMALAAARAAHAPLVISIHMSLAHSARPPGLRAGLVHAAGGRAERHACAVADAVLVLTAGMAGRVVDGGVAPERVRVVPSGIPPGVFRGPFADPLPGAGRPRLVCVGRLATHKDPLTLLEAVARMRVPASVVLVGDGPLRGTVERRIRRLGLAANVTVTGFVSRAQVAAHLAHADVLALPSRYEELGTAIVEAMAMGVPVVASRAGGIPEVVDDGRTGQLVPPGDPRALAAALDGLLSDPVRRAEMAAAAIDAARAYAWDDLAAEVLATYEAVLAGSAAWSGPALPPVRSADA
jgi:glycosyltransferase involved in cell wall biosynthesis